MPTKATLKGPREAACHLACPEVEHSDKCWSLEARPKAPDGDPKPLENRLTSSLALVGRPHHP